METLRVKTLAGLKRQLQNMQKRWGNGSVKLEDGTVFERKVQVLYRGQADAKWPLSTTLERIDSDEYDVLRYMLSATGIVNHIESFTDKRWNTSQYPDMKKSIESSQDSFRVSIPHYDYLVYLRHHGFPSPLLDWTESPFIALYFAAAPRIKRANCAIYAYIERPNFVKGGTGGSPMITVQGPYVSTHKRHFAQKAWYTVATKWDYTNKKHDFVNHEEIFKRSNDRQDILVKIVFPASLRIEILRDLDSYNMNAFTLFQTEDALIESLAVRDYELE